MAKKTPVTSPAKTIAWFEQEISEKTPRVGILAGADQGLWSLVEQSGALAGIWRRHRNEAKELDEAAVSATLGAILAAVVQTAQSVGVSLTTIMEQQVAVMTPLTSARAHQRRAAPVSPALMAKQRQPMSLAVSPSPGVATDNVATPRRSRKRPMVDVGQLPVSGPSVAARTRTSRRPILDQLAPAVAVAPISLDTPKPATAKRRKATFQPTLLSNEAKLVEQRPKRRARTGTT